MRSILLLLFAAINLTVFAQYSETLESRFVAPPGYQRLPLKTDSFGKYLRNLPLKPAGSLVQYYNGDRKANNGVYAAVINLPIGRKNLHQCADAVMHLRAEYLWQKGEHNLIQFHLTNGFLVPYSRWKNGERVIVEGNKTYWKLTNEPSESHEVFWKYLEFIFTYAGTLSLEKELLSISLADMQPGDVWIKGGSPGHAVIVVDMAENESGEKVFILAQSYMPAQELQILQNPNNSTQSPWYALAECTSFLHTPEWHFTADQLRRFP